MVVLLIQGLHLSREGTDEKNQGVIGLKAEWVKQRHFARTVFSGPLACRLPLFEEQLLGQTLQFTKYVYFFWGGGAISSCAPGCPSDAGGD